MAAADCVAIEDITAGNTMKAELADLKQYMLENKTIGGSTAGDIVTIDGSQTLTQKSIISPTINGGAALTSTSDELNKVDGFTGVVADLNAIAGIAAAGITPTEVGYLNGLTQALTTTLATIPATDARTWTYAKGFTTSGTTETIAATTIVTAMGLNSANWIIDPSSVNIQIWDVAATYDYPAAGSITHQLTLTSSGGQTYVKNVILGGLTHGPNNYAIAMTFKVIAKA